MSAGYILHSLMMDFQSSSKFNEAPQMLPPPPGTFIDRKELIQHVGDFAVSQGYVVTIKQSKRDRVVVLGCDRGGVYRDRRKSVDESSAENLRRRKTGSRLTNCPFEAVGKKDDGLWILTVKNGTHNHEPLKDLSDHPSARRFTEREFLLIKEMTEAGMKPRQILKRLRQSNPELLSTPKHLYNVKAKLRQGNLTGAAMILVELAVEAGLPSGVLNIVHGTDDIINTISDDDDIKAISFVGPNSASAHVYSRASAKGKRIQCNISAKNHAVVMPDASIGATLSALVAAGFGAAGQKCMALSTVVFVGDVTPWEDKLVEHAKAIKVSAGTEPNADLGPVISKQTKERICRLIQVDFESGAKLLLDGRNILVPGYENGNFIGPTILSDVTVNMECYKEDIFGPVLLCMQAESIDEAIEIVNRNRYGIGASIFTTSSVTARKFQTEIGVGQVGINVPISVQPPFSSFTSSKPCFAGDLNFDGKAGIQFYTQTKTVTQQWKDLLSNDLANLQLPSSNSEGESMQLPSS